MMEYFIEKLWPIFDQNLNDGTIYAHNTPLTKVAFERVLITFFVASSFSLPIEELLNSPLIVTENLSSYEE